MANKLVSIIVPVYNVEKYLPKCVDSLINQTYKNVEIILVDDGSTDQSGNICDTYLEKDNRIVVLHKKNGGLSDARNFGIEHAKGDYYSFVDSDDYLKEQTIEYLVDAAENNDCQISVCNMIRFYDDGTNDVFYKPCNNQVILENNDRFQTLSQPSVCNKLFKKELFDGVKFPYRKYYEDTFVYHELCYKANKVALTGYDGYWYLYRKGSILGHEGLNNNYFDFIEAVWLRSTFLVSHNVQPYGNEACLSLYAAVSQAEKLIKKDSGNKEMFKKAFSYYLFAYKQLIKSNVSIKQKVRLVLLKYLPELHTKLY